MRRDHHVNFLIANQTKPLLLKTVTTGEDTQTGENIAKEIDAVIEEFGGSDKVVSLVTDNAANMKKAWVILTAKYPGLVVNGCAAQTVNLLVKDICKLDRLNDTLEQVKAITAFVRDRNALTKRFEKIQYSMYEEGDLEKIGPLVSVGATRWYTHHLCVRRVLDNKAVLRQLVETNLFAGIKETKAVKVKKVLFKSLITNDNFWAKLESAEKILRPTSKTLGIFESNKCCLSDIYGVFKSFLLDYGGDPEILSLVQDRWNFLHTESMDFAYFLDPKTRAGEGFIGEDMLDNARLLPQFIVRKGFCDDDAVIQAEYANFIADMKNLSAKTVEFIESNSALTYWYTLGSSKYPILYKVAEIVFKVPTSQAASKRAWSIYDFILTKRRNELSPANVTKLVQLYMNGDIVDENNLLEILMGFAEDVGTEDDAIQLDYQE